MSTVSVTSLSNTPRIFQYCHLSCQSALQHDQLEADRMCIPIGQPSFRPYHIWKVRNNKTNVHPASSDSLGWTDTIPFLSLNEIEINV